MQTINFCAEICKQLQPKMESLAPAQLSKLASALAHMGVYDWQTFSVLSRAAAGKVQVGARRVAWAGRGQGVLHASMPGALC